MTVFIFKKISILEGSCNLRQELNIFYELANIFALVHFLIQYYTIGKLKYTEHKKEKF